MAGREDSGIFEGIPQGHKAPVARLHRLLSIGVALSAEQNLDRLLKSILDAAKELTCADAGTVYVRADDVRVDLNATGRDPILSETPSLVLKLSANDSVEFPFKEMKLPFDSTTIAGSVAVGGRVLNVPDAYRIPAGSPYKHSDLYDRLAGYRTKSMLVVPMKNIQGEVIGVLMLINKKRDPRDRFASPRDAEERAVPFDEVDEEVLTALGSQAAVSIEKATLYAQIQGMFRGFVDSLIGVLERRNYTTAGHCRRMADYAVRTARAINGLTEGPFKDVSFTDEQLEELEYAGLLHDIGKLAVADAVLDKRNKLTDEQIRTIEYRFALAKSQRTDPDGRDRIDPWMEEIRRLNLPRGCSDEDRALLEEIRAERFRDLDGEARPLLTDLEVENLGIRRGNLTAAERKEIERHIVETWNMLKTIPWPKGLRRIPNIAGTHHERMNGQGYPWKLRGEEIPIGGRILAIADVFEALTAQDRPYKPAVPVAKTEEIIRREIEEGRLDGGIFEVFMAHRVFSGHLNEETGKIVLPPGIV